MTQPPQPELLNIAAVASSADHQVRVGVTDGRVDSIHISRALIDPDRPHALEAAVRDTVNKALDAQQAEFTEAFQRFAAKHARDYPELPELARRIAEREDGR